MKEMISFICHATLKIAKMLFTVCILNQNLMGGALQKILS